MFKKAKLDTASYIREEKIFSETSRKKNENKKYSNPATMKFQSYELKAKICQYSLRNKNLSSTTLNLNSTLKAHLKQNY